MDSVKDRSMFRTEDFNQVMLRIISFESSLSPSRTFRPYKVRQAIAPRIPSREGVSRTNRKEWGGARGSFYPFHAVPLSRVFARNSHAVVQAAG